MLLITSVGVQHARRNFHSPRVGGVWRGPDEGSGGALVALRGLEVVRLAVGVHSAHGRALDGLGSVERMLFDLSDQGPYDLYTAFL